MSSIGIGLYGTGIAADNHAYAIAKSRKFSLVSVADDKHTLAQSFSKRHHIDRCHGDLEYLLEDSSVDIVLLTSPFPFNSKIFPFVAETGRSVIIETPLAPSVKEAERIIEKAEEEGIFLFPVSQMVSDPLVSRLSSLIKEGRLGEIKEYSLSWSFPSPVKRWMSIWGEEGGIKEKSLFLFSASPAFDLIYYLFEEDRVTAFREKDDSVNLLSIDVFDGAKRYEDYMKTVGKWFAEEQKLFAKNKALVDKAIAKASYGEMGSRKSFEEISQLELELKRTIIKHGNLINSTMELQDISDNIISKAKLLKLRPAFDFAGQLQRLIKEDRPDKLSCVLFPLFAPRIDKSFSVTSIDHMLTLKAEDNAKTTKVKKEQVDPDFRYEDELLDEQISANFAKLFHELLDQLNKWGRLTLKEYNGILEVKFGKEIYGNKDYYFYRAYVITTDGHTYYSSVSEGVKPTSR